MLPSPLLSFLTLSLAINGVRTDASSSLFSSSSFSASSSASVSSLFSSSPSASVTSNALLSTSSSSHATSTSTTSSSPVSLSTGTTTQSSSSTALSTLFSPSSLSTVFSHATSSSPVPPTFVVASTTLVVTTSDAASVAVVTIPSTSTPTSQDSSSGFWSKKRTVAATFSIVALILCGLIGGAILVLARQRKRDKELKAGEEFSDKQNSMSVDGPPPSPSMTRETTHASPELYMSRDVHFGSDYMHYRGQETCGLEYPPGVSVSNGQPIHFNYSTDSQGHSSAYVSPSVAVNVPPVSYRQPRGRESGTYEPYSTDSFFGGIEEK
ncbi:hypothetical protein AX14_004333 [Amanita brunnescens Koide BX004]|nr:hypothetical protein AX14_004333 [Amanita brunnescens Koide BX004]